MATVNEIKEIIIAGLKDMYDEPERRAIASWLLASVAGIDRVELAVRGQQELDEATEKALMSGLGDLVSHMPIQYVTGQAFFYGLEIEVGPGVLIPRPETEELVHWICKDYSDDQGMRILDIGTGSGCIILALGKLLKNPVLSAVDISGEAIHTAGRNAAKLGVPVDFREMDILSAGVFLPGHEFDIIVSNPPYVRDSERRAMKPNVLDYEPQAALFVKDDDPLVFYRAIAAFAMKNLKKQGKLYVEINEALGRETVTLFREHGFSDIVLKQDFRGRDRLIRAGF